MQGKDKNKRKKMIILLFILIGVFLITIGTELYCDYKIRQIDSSVLEENARQQSNQEFRNELLINK